jgi:hypothetical protein
VLIGLPAPGVAAQAGDSAERHPQDLAAVPPVTEDVDHER